MAMDKKDYPSLKNCVNGYESLTSIATSLYWLVICTKTYTKHLN